MAPAKKSRAIVHFPSSLQKGARKTGKIYGIHHADTNRYNIVSISEKSAPGLEEIGEIFEDRSKVPQDAPGGIVGFHDDAEGIVFFQGDEKCLNESYDLQMDIFSRNTGILETGKMLDKSVIISGCGSVGSLVALELARAGVGNFLLADNDIFGAHNICRHQCGLYDIGRYKVDAVADRMRQINPEIRVSAQRHLIERIDKESFDSFIRDASVIVGCADSREADLYANRISRIYNIPFVSIGFWERAFAGELFYALPSQPCYACLFGKRTAEFSGRVSANRRFYTNEAELEKAHFEPGISCDINFITNIGVKIILDLLNIGNEDYSRRAIGYLKQFTLVCNSAESKSGGAMAEIFSHPMQITSSIEFERDSECSVCLGASI